MSGSELRSGRNLEFGVDVSQVKLDGLEAHREPFGGLPVGQPGSDELRDRQFGRGELARPRPPLAPAADAGELAIGAFEIRLGANLLKDAPRFGCPIGSGLALAEPGQDEAMSGGKARGLERLGKPRRYRRRLVEGLQRGAGVVTVGFKQAAYTGGAHQC